MMYERFFGLARPPFETSPDPAFLFNSPVHREAIATIEYGVMTGAGFMLLTGEVGLGKTTAIRTFLARHDPQQVIPIYVFHPLLDFADLLKLLADELELDPAGRHGFDLLRQLQHHLIALNRQGRRVVLVLDESHRLPEETLENLRLLSNLETDKAKLLQIILVGQPELEAVLALPRMRQLEQRIVLKVRLEKLASAEARSYIAHRLSMAGSDDPHSVLSAPAIAAIADLCDGIPRRMNILAHRVLIEAFGLDQRPISQRLARSVAAQDPGYRSVAKQGIGRRWLLLAAGLTMAISVGALAIWQSPGLRPRAPAVGEVGDESRPAAPEPVDPATASWAAEPTIAPVIVPIAQIEAIAAVPSLTVAGPGSASGKQVGYLVAPGDSVWSICRQKYGPDTGVRMMAKVMALNGIAVDTHLMAGDRIQLPAAE